MRKALDTVYGTALAGSCLAMVTIATLVLIQVGGRIIDHGLTFLGVAPLGVSVPSLAEFGGFLFVAAAFLALPSTLRAAGHVRVTLILRAFGPAGNRVLAAVVLAIAAGLAGFATWHVILSVLDAHAAGMVSYGRIVVPLWIPKTLMATGLVIFTVALIDELVTTLRGDDPAFRTAERARDTREGPR
ncbi:TRAP transporter small permease [Roseovarius tibetensis]|uniref:TRAP transporter small permease n=1 Tax=Roseovarius tibetensis TaxID=2685897 RepID=UPI003D7F90C4